MRIFLLACVSCLMLVGSLAAQEAQPSGSIAVETDAGTDQRIRDRIRDIMQELEGYGAVRVAVSEGIVTFTGEALDAEAIARLEQLAARVDGVVAIENQVVETTDVVERLNPVAERFVERLRQLWNFGPLLAVAVISGFAVIAAGWALARWKAPFARFAPNAFIADIYRMLIRLAFVIAGVVVALDIMNATALLGTLLGAAGIVGLAVGFAVRDTVENFIASVMLSLRQPFRPNDFIEIAGDMGSVIRLTSRATILLDPSGNHIRIPNATVFKSRIINYSRNPERRFDFDLGVEPAADLAEVRRIGLEVLAGLPYVLATPAPDVWIMDSGDSTVLVKFLGWIDQRETSLLVARGDALRLVMAALTEAGVDLPEPGYRLRLPEGLSVESRAAEVPAKRAVRVDATPLDVSPDHALEDLVEEERRELAGSDLLSDEAPEE